MGIVSMHLFLAMAIFTAANNTTTGISTRGCTSNIDILKKELVARQVESYLRNEKDIIEIQVKTNTCIALTNDGNTISNKTFASASPIEKYNMFIYFIVTYTGSALMQYPADTDTMALRALGSPKVMMDVDVMLDNHDCALKTEQFRNIFLQTISKLAPITNNDDISVCYYEVSEKDLKFNVELLFLPYYTYNHFKTFCLSGDVVTEVPQALPNILLRWLCIALHLTLPIGFFFIPHTVYKKTNSYRKCDIPYSLSMLLSYITYWTPDGSSDNKEVKEGNVNGEHSEQQQKKCCNKCRTCINYFPWENPLLRLFISIALVFFLFGFGIHYYLRNTNELENDLLALSGSSAFYHMHAIKKTSSCSFTIVVVCYVLLVCVGLIFVALLSTLIRRCSDCFIPHSEVNATEEISYPIYAPVYVKNKPEAEGECCVCKDQSQLILVTERADLNTTIKLVSEGFFNATFWWKLCMKMWCIGGIFFSPFVLIFLIPYVNNCITSAVKDFKYSVDCKKPKVECKKCKVCSDCKKRQPCLKVFCEKCKPCSECTKYQCPKQPCKNDTKKCIICEDCKKRQPCPKVDCNKCKLCEDCKDHQSCHISPRIKRLKYFLISFYHVVKLACTIVIVNITLIQTTTLILQYIVLLLFVGIPFYPNHLSNVIMLTGFIKYIMQAFLKFQSKAKYVLDQMFKEDIYKDKDDIRKKEFNIVLKQCSSVNILVVFMKILALTFVWFTACKAINLSPAGLSAWKDVIPSLILLIAPDWLSNFIYNEAAENQYIDQCVKTAMRNLEKEGRRQTSTGDTEQTSTVDNGQTSTVDNGQTSTVGNGQTSTGGNGQTSTRGNGQTSTGVNGQTSTGGNGQTSTGGNGQTSTGVNGQTSTGGNGQTSTRGNGQTRTGGNGQTTEDNRQTSTGGNGQTSTGGNGQTSTEGNGQTSYGGNGQTSTRGNGQTSTENVKQTSTVNIELKQLTSSNSTRQ